jgi:hypothetical protein
MKQFKILLWLIISLFLFSNSGISQNKEVENEVNKNIIEVIDFHTTNRCITCKAIEANTKYTLEMYFSEELENGTITFQVINLDEKENASLGEKFYASGTSLYLNVIGKVKENQIDLTQFAFMYGKKQDEFSKKLKIKIEKQLAKF